MTSKFTVDGTSTKITFEYTALTTVVLDIVTDAAEYLFDRGSYGTEEEPILFEDLTNIEKLGLIDKHLKQVIIDLANTHKSIKAQDAARAAEDITKYEL